MLYFSFISSKKISLLFNNDLNKSIYLSIIILLSPNISIFFEIILHKLINSINLILVLLLINIFSISLKVSSDKASKISFFFDCSIAFKKKLNFSKKFKSFWGIIFSCISIIDICILVIESFIIFSIFGLLSFFISPILKLYKKYIKSFCSEFCSFKLNSKLQS